MHFFPQEFAFMKTLLYFCHANFGEIGPIVRMGLQNILETNYRGRFQKWSLPFFISTS